jgi:hypothetical protein
VATKSVSLAKNAIAASPTETANKWPTIVAHPTKSAAVSTAQTPANVDPTPGAARRKASAVMARCVASIHSRTNEFAEKNPNVCTVKRAMAEDRSVRIASRNQMDFHVRMQQKFVNLVVVMARFVLKLDSKIVS